MEQTNQQSPFSQLVNHYSPAEAELGSGMKGLDQLQGWVRRAHLDKAP